LEQSTEQKKLSLLELLLGEINMTENQLIALQNVLDCMDHYMLIDHVRDEYRESDWRKLERQVASLQTILKRNPLPNTIDRPFERVYINWNE
tara:strand:+ start:180 stop:455 length:276 start_codon:yes stop_codon:yes gene_type:complete